MVEAQVTAPLVRTARHRQHRQQEEEEEEDTEYAFPLSTNASAFSPDPQQALVEAGATQQGFIVCVKGSFGFIRLHSGQSPDDLFFHISALEQVRGSEERSAGKGSIGRACCRIARCACGVAET